jgi:hypothetical protein
MQVESHSVSSSSNLTFLENNRENNQSLLGAAGQMLMSGNMNATISSNKQISFKGFVDLLEVSLLIINSSRGYKNGGDLTIKTSFANQPQNKSSVRLT